MKVLIVDDSTGNRKLLRALLELENFRVVEAPDGAQALAALEREPMDAIISDILMPCMDGYRLCYEVRKKERWQAVPFIFYTGTYNSPSDEKLCYDLGGDNYLQKPASAETIYSALRNAVKAGARLPSKRVAPSASDVMKEYSERLVSKLEARNEELARASKNLEAANRELSRRTEQLEHASAALQQTNSELDLRVRQRTSELEAFSYSVSHDLRAPLRHIGGFAHLILASSDPALDKANLNRLNVICRSAQKMSALIDALLDLSTVANTPLQQRPIDLSALARDIVAELRQSQPRRAARVLINPGLNATGDHRLLQVVLMNLLGNAWKFTSKRPNTRIEFGRHDHQPDCPYFVRDNGAGFDMAGVDKLFTAFQRLHRHDEFEGAGIGLATVQRIIQRHGGKIWAKSAPQKGSVFYFTLGKAA